MEWHKFEIAYFTVPHDVMGFVYIRIEMQLDGKFIAVTGNSHCYHFPKAAGYRAWGYPTIEEARHEAETSWPEMLVRMCLESVDTVYNLNEVLAHTREIAHRQFMEGYNLYQAALFD
jgi:hypothetical protein